MAEELRPANRGPQENRSIGVPPRRAVMIAIDVPQNENTVGLSGVPLPRAMEVFINPDQVQVTANAVWTKIDILGLSHQVQQYSHTESVPVEFTLEWSFHEAVRRSRRNRTQIANGQNPNEGNSYDPFAGIRELSENQAFIYRDFLYSFTVPLERGRAPSRCMLIWPNFLSIIGVVSPVNFNFTKWSTTGIPMAWSAGITLTEHRVVFRQRAERSDFFTQIDQELTGQDQELNQAAGIIRTGSDVLTDLV